MKMSSFGRSAFLIPLLLALFLPSLAAAQSVLEIIDINTKEAPKVSIFFSARQANGQPIGGLKAENISLLIEQDAPPLTTKGLRSFKEGDRPVAVVFVFPIAKDYIEEFFGIRTNIANTIRLMRPVDFVGAVAYDSGAQTFNMVTGADIGGLADTIQSIPNTEVIEPSMFGSLPPAVGILRNLEGVKQKYIVLVSNAEGSIVGDPKESARRISMFQQSVKDAGIRPLIVGYTPDGPDDLTYRNWLKQLSMAGGTYTEATSRDDLPQALQQVYDQIFLQYILDAEVDLSGDYWLEEGKYTFTVQAKVGSMDLKASDKAPWPTIKKSYAWIWWLVLSIVGGLVLLIGLIIIIKKIANRRSDDPEAPIYQAQGEQPQEYRCETCGKQIPESLFGFRGEFCLVGGVPDCPYYQMPDQGKLQITKGQLADTTFFIKKEITTIGSFLENDVALVDKSVSKKHAAIKMDEGKRYEIRDFGSTNGTYVAGERIQRKFLRDGDILTFGNIEVVFKLK